MAAGRPDRNLICRRMDKQHFAIDRKHERIELSLPCRLGMPGSKQHAATILNLSLGGLKFSCDRQTFMAIIPEEQHTPGQIADVRISVKFTLRPAARRAMNMDLSAMIVHTERLAQDVYHVGIQFTDLRKTDLNRLDDYIEEVQAAGEND